MSMCIILGVLVYNSSDVPDQDTSTAKPGALAHNSNNAPNTKSPIAEISDLDFVGIILSIMSVAPLLVGLSFAGSLYRWDEWQVIVPIASGSVFLLLLIFKKLWLVSALFPLGSRNAS